jgi:hypothetical protein
MQDVRRAIHAAHLQQLVLLTRASGEEIALMLPEMIPPNPAWEVELEKFLNQVDDGSIPFAEQLPLARRFAWEGTNGRRVPDGFWLKHECNTRACVNPAHAILVETGAPPA